MKKRERGEQRIGEQEIKDSEGEKERGSVLCLTESNGIRRKPRPTNERICITTNRDRRVSRDRESAGDEKLLHLALK